MEIENIKIGELITFFENNALLSSLKRVLNCDVKIEFDINTLFYTVVFDGNVIEDYYNYTDGYRFINILRDCLSCKHDTIFNENEIKPFISLYYYNLNKEITSFLRNNTTGIIYDDDFETVMKKYILDYYRNKLNGGKENV